MNLYTYKRVSASLAWNETLLFPRFFWKMRYRLVDLPTDKEGDTHYTKLCCWKIKLFHVPGRLSITIRKVFEWKTHLIFHLRRCQLKITGTAVIRIRTWHIVATKQCTNNYTITAVARRLQCRNEEVLYIWISSSYISKVTRTARMTLNVKSRFTNKTH